MGHQVSSPARRPVSRRLSARPRLTIVEVSIAMFLLLLGSAVYPFSAAARATRPPTASASVAPPTAAAEPAFDLTGAGESAAPAGDRPAVATGDEAANEVPAAIQTVGA